jgi:putative holliday junction resolvase
MTGKFLNHYKFLGLTMNGRILALDLGEKRIGVALSDEGRMLARSLLVFKRSSRAADFALIGRLVAEHGVTLILVGLPIRLDGVEGDKAAWARDYGTALAKELRIATEFWDESLSTVKAEASLEARGESRRKRRGRIDAVAAAVILQDYLDNGLVNSER